MPKFVSTQDLQNELHPILVSQEGLYEDVQYLLDGLGSLQSDYETLVKLYNSELKQYKACVAAYRKLTTILLELPDFKEKWDKFHEAPDYDRR